MTKKKLENKIFEDIKDILVEDFFVKRDRITMESVYYEDLGLDSVDFFVLVVKVENKFGIETPNDGLDSPYDKISNLVNYLKENKGKYVNSLIKGGYK